MKVFIAPGMLQYLTDAEVEWIKSSAKDNLKLIRDAVSFATSHPEAAIILNIGATNGKAYILEVYERDPDDCDVVQLAGYEGRTSYSADILRIDGDVGAFAGRVYL
jgi:hypothetical protein